MGTFSWRYLAYADGSFCRMSNTDHSLDAYTDADLAHLEALHRGDEAHEVAWRACSRCRGGLTLYWRGPWVSGVMMELCPACDAHKPAARAFLAWHQDPDRDPAVLPRLFEDWESETMHAHGWARATEPETLPAPPPHPRLIPRGTG